MVAVSRVFNDRLGIKLSDTQIETLRAKYKVFDEIVKVPSITDEEFKRLVQENELSEIENRLIETRILTPKIARNLVLDDDESMIQEFVLPSRHRIDILVKRSTDSSYIRITESKTDLKKDLYSAIGQVVCYTYELNALGFTDIDKSIATFTGRITDDGRNILKQLKIDLIETDFPFEDAIKSNLLKLEKVLHS